jgi:hypothetical protein
MPTPEVPRSESIASETWSGSTSPKGARKKFHLAFTTRKEGSKTEAKEHGETSTDRPVDGVTDGCPMYVGNS